MAAISFSGKEQLHAGLLGKADVVCAGQGEPSNQQILFLMHTYTASGREKYLGAAQALLAAQHDRHKANPFNMSYANGCSGTAYLYIKLYEITGNREYLAWALELMAGADDYLQVSTVGDGLYRGRAGVLLVLLYLYDATRQADLLPLMDRYTRRIIVNAVSPGVGLGWYNPHQLVIQPLASLGYGASGIGYVFRQLGDYFGHDPFRVLADKAFEYVNQSCFDAGLNRWNDYRKEITSQEALAEHLDHLHRNDTAFFKTATANYSINHGMAGIGYAQPANGLVMQSAEAVPDVAALSPGERASLGHLYLELYARHGSPHYLSRAEILLESGGPGEHTPLGVLESATLELSYLKRESCSFKYPKLLLKTPSPGAGTFVSFPEIGRLLAEKPFAKTLAYLKQLGTPEPGTGPGRETFQEGADFVAEQVANCAATEVQAEILRDVLAYERKFQDLKREQRQSPFHYIRQHDLMQKRLQSLDVHNREMLKKKVVLSDRFTLHSTYGEIEDLAKVTKLPGKSGVFWEYNVEEGAIECQLGIMAIIIKRFKRPAAIEKALMELLLYCFVLSKKQLHPLVSDLGKGHFLRRVPLLTMGNIRLLVAYGVLEFAPQQETKSLKTTLMGPVLRLLKLRVDEYM